MFFFFFFWSLRVAPINKQSCTFRGENCVIPVDRGSSSLFNLISIQNLIHPSKIHSIAKGKFILLLISVLENILLDDILHEETNPRSLGNSRIPNFFSQRLNRQEFFKFSGTVSSSKKIHRNPKKVWKTPWLSIDSDPVTQG